ncbi:MAG: hypothetical protein RI885_1519 [Actinomycetota bacterium]
MTVAAVVFLFDQGTKLLVVQNLPLGQSVPVLGEVLQFFYVKNPGAAFSLASGYTWIFSIAASAVVVFIVVFARRIRSSAWAILFGMLLGGTLGNLVDRLFREPSFGLGHVVDFIQVIGFPAVFNIADSFIVASMGLFIIVTVRGVHLDGSRDKRPDAAAAVGHPDLDRTADQPDAETPDADQPDADQPERAR